MLFDLILSIVIVFIASLLFVNALEYISFKFNFSKNFAGTIISPLFTSFPELVIFIVAIFEIGSVSGTDEALGTIFGETFISSSLSYSLVFISILFSFLIYKKYRGKLNVNKDLAIPYLFISILFPILIIPFYFNSLKYFFGVIFILMYIIYFYIIYKRKDVEMFEESERPYFSIMGINLGTAIQVILSIILIYYGSRMLLVSLISFSLSMKMDLIALSIIIIPAATAIPETITAMIWGFKGSDTLSIGSLVGEKILYSTLYPGLALIILPLTFSVYILISIIATTFVSIIYSILIFKGKFSVYYLLLGFIFFVIYIIIIK